jgi:hypothetical protein
VARGLSVDFRYRFFSDFISDVSSDSHGWLND